MKKILQSFFLFLIINVNSYAGDVFDRIANYAAQNVFNLKVSGIYNKALACEQLEIDPVNGKTAREWMEMEPQIPDWKRLEKISQIAYEAKIYAEAKTGSDKIKHCFGGCFIRKNLDLKSAMMTGWLKELLDSSDCSPSTHFEESDYYATVGGGIAAEFIVNCEDFCQREDLQNLNGEQIYDQSLKLDHETN